MSERNLKSHLQDYYAGRGPSAATCDELARLATAASPVTGRAGRLRTGLTIALAACAALAVAGNFYAASQWRAARQELNLLRVAAAAAEQRAAVALERAAAAEAAHRAVNQHVPRLVLVRTILQGCPLCPPLEPIFAELTDRYSEQPVLFVTRDLTTPDSRQRWVEMTKALDIEWLSPLTRYSGQIQLADRDQREILARLQNDEQLPQLEAAFARALHPDE